LQGLFATAQTLGMALRNVGFYDGLHVAVWFIFKVEIASYCQLSTANATQKTNTTTR